MSNRKFTFLNIRRLYKENSSYAKYLIHYFKLNQYFVNCKDNLFQILHYPFVAQNVQPFLYLQIKYYI